MCTRGNGARQNAYLDQEAILLPAAGVCYRTS